ncbi:MAG: hypothetical protein IJM59_13045 [Proteobacteria bacterium]|nr:hypothetical protein [Pseudomonadota bacterium]
MKRDTTNYVGKVFGHLTVTSEAETINNKRYVNCECDCGSSIKVRLSSLKDGHTKSCHCLSKDKASRRLKAVHAGTANVPTKAYIPVLYAYVMGLWTEGDLRGKIRTTLSIDTTSTDDSLKRAFILVTPQADENALNREEYTLLLQEDTSEDFFDPHTTISIQNGKHLDFNDLSGFKEYREYESESTYIRLILLIKDRTKPSTN